MFDCITDGRTFRNERIARDLKREETMSHLGADVLVNLAPCLGEFAFEINVTHAQILQLPLCLSERGCERLFLIAHGFQLLLSEGKGGISGPTSTCRLDKLEHIVYQVWCDARSLSPARCAPALLATRVLVLLVAWRFFPTLPL